MLTFVELNPIHPARYLEHLESTEFSEAAVPVRRPILGITSNREIYSTLQILAPHSSGSGVSWVPMLNTSGSQGDNGGTGESNGTANFILNRVRHPRRERFQFVETFGESYLYMYGETPRFLEVQGVLFKSRNFPWRTEWLHNYDTVMRANKTVERAARVYLTVEDTIYEGHLLMCDVVDDAKNPNMSAFSFSMFLTNVMYGGLPEVDSTATYVGPATPPPTPPLGELFSADARDRLRWETSLSVDTAPVWRSQSEYLAGLPWNANDITASERDVGEAWRVDASGNIHLVGLGGLGGRRYTTAAEAADNIDVQAWIDAERQYNQSTGVSVTDPDHLREIRDRREALGEGFGFGNGSLMGPGAVRFARMLSNGWGGFAASLDTTSRRGRALAAQVAGL